ncbi:MAG: CBS domain-containing protein [Candidatus Methanomethylophilaceae archaeon]|nr:CBS domain-containing protein [Candidatus Methanomethylophilaceae archaeon]
MTLRVRDLMTTDVVTLQPTDTIKTAAIKFAVDNISGAPVVDNRNHLLGIVSQNDILRTLLKYQDLLDKDNPEGLSILKHSLDSGEGGDRIVKAVDEISDMEISTIMTYSTLTTSADAPILDVLRAMITMDVNRVPVIEKGVLIGIISRGDITFALYKRKA